MKYTSAEIKAVEPNKLKIFSKTILRRFLEDYKQIVTGKELNVIKLRPREALGAFIVCAIGQFLDPEPENKWTIGSDPESQDGMVLCFDGPRKGDGFGLEQVYVPYLPDGEVTDKIIESIQRKIDKGTQYGKDRNLIVLCDKPGSINVERVREFLLDKANFSSYWILSRDMDLSKWDWIVTTAKAVSDPSLIYKFSLSKDFDIWDVEILGKIKGT